MPLFPALVLSGLGRSFAGIVDDPGRECKACRRPGYSSGSVVNSSG